MIKFHCPNCDAEISAGPEHGGLVSTCPSCKQEIVIPSMSEPESPIVGTKSRPRCRQRVSRKWKGAMLQVAGVAVGVGVISGILWLTLFKPHAQKRGTEVNSIGIISIKNDTSTSQESDLIDDYLPKPDSIGIISIKNDTPTSQESDLIDDYLPKPESATEKVPRNVYDAYMAGYNSDDPEILLYVLEKSNPSSIGDRNAQILMTQGALDKKGGMRVRYEFAFTLKDDISVIKEAADRGDYQAMCVLGQKYYFGEGVDKDATEGLAWTDRSAKLGYSFAQVRMAVAYRDGTERGKDLKKSAKLFRYAAEQGNGMGQSNLAFAYLLGKGVEVNHEAGIKLLSQGAEKGDTFCQLGLGQCYNSGLGIEKNLTMAFEWFEKAAACPGNPAAQECLGMCYERGEGVKMNLEEALAWYRKAVENGSCLEQGSYSAKENVARVEKLLSATATNGSSPESHVPSALPGFALIPAGEFTMGDSLDGDKDAPPHQVNVSAFHIQKTEVTKAEWDTVRTWAVSHGYTDLAKGEGKAAEHPVHTVSWWDVVKWCNARSEKDGLTPCYAASGLVMRTGTTVPTVNWIATGSRLPTEAEWDKAARGGLSGKRFPWGDTISHSQANYSSNSAYAYDESLTQEFHPIYGVSTKPHTSPVGSFAANGYGLHNMPDNVSEWCWDWYGPYAPGEQTNPRGASLGKSRVYRGGSWYNDAGYCRIADRNINDPANTYSRIGFRTACGSVPSKSR